MIVETRNSSYEIDGIWIRKIGGGPSTEHKVGSDWVMFEQMMAQPLVGNRLVLNIGGKIFRTSEIASIVVPAK